MTIEFPDVTNILETYSGEDVSESMGNMMQLVRKAAQKTNSQIVYFNANKCVLMWNSLISQSNHKHLACRTALYLIHNINISRDEWSKKGLPELSTMIGISSDIGYYGNIGSDQSFKIFVAIGRPIWLSEKICSFNSEYGTHIIVSKVIYESVNDEFYLRSIQKIVQHEGNEEFIFELGDAKSQDSWVYELNSNNADQLNEDKWKEYLEGYELFQQDMFNEVLEHFNSYLSKCPYDALTKKMIEECHYNISGLSSTRTDVNIYL